MNPSFYYFSCNTGLAKRSKIIIIGILVLFCLNFFYWNFIWGDKGYSCDIIQNGAYDGKLYWAQDKARREFPSGEILITRGDKEVLWTLYPDKKVFTEEPYPYKNFIQVSKIPLPDPKNLEWEYAGSEVIGDLTVDKYKIVYTVGEEEIVLYNWVIANTSFPVKGERSDGTILEYTNLKTGRQPARLFEIPFGYQKLVESK